MRVKYRIWLVRYGPQKSRLWAVAANHGDGKKRTPFIYARSAAAAMDKLRQRLERRSANLKKRRKPPMRSENA